MLTLILFLTLRADTIHQYGKTWHIDSIAYRRGVKEYRCGDVWIIPMDKRKRDRSNKIRL